MLTHLDEHFYHQIPTTMDRVVDSDPRWVDNHWFQAMDTRGRFIVGANLAVFPNNSVVDGGQIVLHGSMHYNLRYSRRWRQEGLRSERLNLRVGPAWMEVLEPGRKARFVLEPDNEHGVSYDLVFDTYLRPIEARTPIYHRRGRGPRERLPYHQHLGRFTGTLHVDGETYAITPGDCWGQRDRCWGMLGGFGEKFHAWTPPAPKEADGLLHWHSHMQFEDVGFWFWLEERRGRPRLGGTIADTRGGVFDGAVTWPVGDPRAQIRLVDIVDYQLESRPDTGKFQSARATLVDEYGGEHGLEFRILAPNATRWILGEGYGDPEFLGGYNGEFFHRHDKYDLEDPADLRKASFGVSNWNMGEHAVRCTYDGRVGYGHMELFGTPPLARWGTARPRDGEG